MDNATRKALINKGKSVGFNGDYLEVFRAYDQGVDIIDQFVAQQQQAAGASPLLQSLKTPDPSQQMMVPPQQQLPQIPVVPSNPPSAPQTRVSIPQQAPSPLVNSAEASGVGLASTAKGPSGGQEIMRRGGVRKFALGGSTQCPPGLVPTADGQCVKDLTTAPTPNSSLYSYYTTAVSKYGEDIAKKMVQQKRTCKPGEECWKEPEPPSGLERRQYTIKPTGDAAIDRLNAIMFGNKGVKTDNGYIPLDDPKYNPYK